MNKFSPKVLLAISLMLLSLALAGCAVPAAVSTASQPSEPTAARIFFTTPENGATVANPVKVQMGAENFSVEAAGEIKPGAGHLHILVDADCIEAGNVIPKDETHLHYGQGQIEAELELAPGEHTLCLQAADGAHFALPGDGMTQIISLTVQ